MSRYIELKNTRGEFLERTGMPVEEFEKYLPDFTAAYQELYPSETGYAHSLQRSGQLLAHMEDKLLLIWLHDKAQQTSLVLGPQFGLNQSETEDWIYHLHPVLNLTFAKLMVPQLSMFCIQFLQALNTCQAEYIIVGGYAVAFHGYRRPILDLDIFIATHSQNAQKMVRVLEACGNGVTLHIADYFQMEQRVIRIGLPPFSIERSERGERFLQFGSAPSQLEILTSISAVSFEECYPERVPGLIERVPVPFIGLTHLKRNKQAGIRAKDADDLAHLS
jgi:hypothetical protein